MRDLESALIQLGIPLEDFLGSGTVCTLFQKLGV